MFWRFGGYANVSTIDTLLEKPDVTLEELLDEGDLIQELKSHNTKLIEYLREDPVLEKLLEYVVAPKLEPVASEQGKGADKIEDFREISKCKGRERSISGSHLNAEDEEDEKEKRRSRYAYVAAEILSSDSWSLSAALFENQALLRKFWDFLKLAPPLDPLQAGYFTKVNEALLDKKTEEMLDLFKSLDNVVKNMLQHVDSPMVMDLLLKIVSLEKVEGGQGIVDWLHSQDLIPLLLSFLSAENSWATQTSAGDFLKAIIAISANASQNEQSCIGPNELTRQLVSSACVQKLINDMLKGGNPLTVGVGIVIEVIRKNNSDYDPDLGAEANTPPTNRDPIYLGTLLRLFAAHVPDFMALVLSPNHTIGGDSGLITTRRKELNAAFGSKFEPLGFDRFKTCELMAELLHCSNMGLLNEIGSEEFIRARDLERERLKVEGRFVFSTQERQVSSSEDLTMKSSMSRFGSTSPDDMRRLEVQNVSDDDGFEEVTHSGVLGDDAKDDFDEKPDLDDDLLPSTKLDTPLSFLDKDDEEFIDEPLSSPRLNSDTEHLKASHPQDIGLQVEPLSYTKTPLEKASKIILYKGVNAPPEDITFEQSISEAEIDKRSLESLEGASVEFQLQSEVGDAECELASKLQIPLSPEPHDYGLSPHPEDKPAPLFALRQVEPFQLSQSSDEVVPVFENSGSTTDIIAEAGGGFNSVLMDNTEDYSTVNPVDEHQAEPVVGDFLKMQFVEHKVVPTILDSFFRFPWNNFLHNVVYDVVQQVFNGPMDRGYNRTLAIDLFDTGDITYRIVEGQRKSDEAQERNKMRLGYMGHLTLIAEEVVKFTERHPSELLSDSVLEKVTNAEWNNYVEVTLAETRERDNAILGGVRPDMSIGSRQAAMNAVNAASGFGGASSALAEAGLNGSAMLEGMELFNGNGLSSTGFALTGGSLLSSFGSSSDDEDEEMEDDNDQEGSRNTNSGNAEFSRYMTTPSTGSIDSMSSAPSVDLEPPFAPPPPPPLNIPPSRARRQLAARLALHKQSTENGSFPNGDELSLEKCGQPKVVNPFATDEDDEEHDDFTIGDLEHEAKGMGHCPPGAVPSSQPVPMDDLDLEVETPKHYVGNSSKSSTGTRAHFPLMWPFGQTQRSSYDCETNVSYRGKEKERVRAKLSSIFGGHLDLSVGGNNKGANRNRANDDGTQSSDESASDDDDSDDEFGASAGIAGAKSKIHRRLSTTEATRRTSIEDDDDEGEVVHVTRRTAVGDDEDLIEIQHISDFAHNIS